MKLAALLSGGKDSVYAIKKALEDHDVVKLISVESVEGSKFFHTNNIELVKLQAEAMDIPLIYRETSEEKELEVLEETIGSIKDEIDGIVSGAIASSYQKDIIGGICEKLGLESLAPLWRIDGERLMKNLIEEGFEVVITKVAARGLGKEWLGRRLDLRALEDLKKIRERYRINLSGEGGEFETLVTDCSLFKKKIVIVGEEKLWDRKTKSGAMKLDCELDVKGQNHKN